MSEFLVTRETIHEVIGNKQEIVSIAEEVVGYNKEIANHSLSALTDQELAQNSWEMFVDGLHKFPFTIPVGEKRLSDYPEVIRDIADSGFEGFYGWLKDVASDNTRLENVREQAIMRNVFHFFDYAVRMGDEIPPNEIETMREEFKNLNYFAKTKWLSRFVNGLQTSLIEVYITEKYFSLSLEPNNN